ncbi:helix-turn-helix domain-containing protein [uncultured Pseudoteredinibacter sp.]|uniref:winged helix-turn-helix domain-containing protein n=1 Tax=uncultured Pseudoteredinibacter sp. TaxID=1641701 RepID=UPI00261B9738|nr:helix-turn-helix domain-containing protein [uncultured Pseudoteredinibacter sp.]
MGLAETEVTISQEYDNSSLNKIFSAFADRVTRELLDIILEEPGITTGVLCERFPVSRFSIMRRLNNLEEAGLLERFSEGKTQRLYIKNGALKPLINGWLHRVLSKNESSQQ